MAGSQSAVDPWEAAGTGDVQQLQRWLGSGGKVDARRWQDGFTLLMVAANNNQVELIEWLIDHGADLRAEHVTNGSTALWWAATQGHWGVMEVLMKAGLSHRHAVPETCTTALMAAAMHGHAAVGRSLMGIARANPNVIEQVGGNTALHLAAWAGHAHGLTTLVAYTDICTRNFMGYTALDIAREAGKASCVPILEAAQRSEELWTVAANGTTEQVLALLEGGVSCEAVVLKAGQQIPLHSAARNGKSNNSRALMAYGAKVDMKDVYGCTALHYAVAGRHARFVQMLLESGADLSISNNDEQTALDIARSFLTVSTAEQEPSILALLQGDVTAVSVPTEPPVVPPPPTAAADGNESSVKQQEEEEDEAGASDAASLPGPPPTASGDRDTVDSDDEENAGRASADENDVKKPPASEMVLKGDDRAQEKKRRSRGKKADSAAKAAKDRAKQEARAKQEEEEALRRAVEEARRAQEQQESIGEGGEGGGSGGGGKADRRRRMAQLKEQKERQKAMEEEQQKRKDASAQQQTTAMHADENLELGNADAAEVMGRFKAAAELAANYRKAQQLKEEEERKKEALDKSSGGKGKKDKKRLQGQKKVEQAHPQPLAELATKLLHTTADKLKANQELDQAEMRHLLLVIQKHLNEISRWGMVEGLQAAQELLRVYIKVLQRAQEEERKQSKISYARVLQELSQREGGLMGVYQDLQDMKQCLDAHDFPALVLGECAGELGREEGLRLMQYIYVLAPLKNLGLEREQTLSPLLELQYQRIQNRLRIEDAHNHIDWGRVALVALRLGYNNDQVSELKAGRYVPDDIKQMLEVVEGSRTLLSTFDDKTKQSLGHLKEATLAQVHSPFDDAQAMELRRCNDAVAAQLNAVQALIESEARMAEAHRPRNWGLLSALDWANDGRQWGRTHADRYGYIREHAHEHTGECVHGDDGGSVHAHAHAHEHKCGHTHSRHEHGHSGGGGEAECGHEGGGSGRHEDRLLMGMGDDGGGGWRDGFTGEDHHGWSRGGYVYKGPGSGSSSSSSFGDEDDEERENLERLCDAYGLRSPVPGTGNRRVGTEAVLQQLSRAIQDHPHILHGLQPELQHFAHVVLAHAQQAAFEESIEELLHRGDDGPIVMSASDPSHLRALLQDEDFERIREKAGEGQWGNMQRGVGSTDSDDMHEFEHEPGGWTMQPYARQGLYDDSDDNSMRAHGPMSPLQHPYSPIDHIASPLLAGHARTAMEMSPPPFLSPTVPDDVFSDDIGEGDTGGDSDRGAAVSPVAYTGYDAAEEHISKEG